MKKFIPFCLVTILILSFKGCFKDDLSNCPAKLQVYFESVMTKYEYETVTNRLDLFLYNGMDELSGMYTYSKAELEAVNYRPVIPLGTCDRYTLLALVNVADCYEVSDTETLGTFRVALKSTANDTVRQKQTELFFAREELSMTDMNLSDRCVYQTLPLYKNTNHIFVDVAFESSYNLATAVPGAYIKGNNGSFDQYNTCHTNSHRVYLPHKVSADIGNVTVQYQFTTMQLWIGSDILLLLEEQQSEIFRLKIMEHISKVYDTNEKLDQEDRFYLTLVLTDDFTILELSVNGWYVIRSGVEV